MSQTFCFLVSNVIAGMWKHSIGVRWESCINPVLLSVYPSYFGQILCTVVTLCLCNSVAEPNATLSHWSLRANTHGLWAPGFTFLPCAMALPFSTWLHQGSYCRSDHRKLNVFLHHLKRRIYLNAYSFEFAIQSSYLKQIRLSAVWRTVTCIK